MAEEEAVLAICSDVLGSGVDEDSLAYIASAVVDDGVLMERDDLVDFVQPMLEDCCDGDEDKAGALAGRLYDALAAKFKGAPVAVAEPKEFKGNVKIASLMAVDAAGAWEADVNNRGKGVRGYIAQESLKAGTGENTSAAKSDAKAAAKDAKIASRGFARAEGESHALDAEIEQASANSVVLRGSKGINFTSALKVGPFDLPHPGGQGNLLNDASFTLTPGRRYALIGRNGKGKSTLLKNLAARRVGTLPDGMRTHYVSQDVKLTDGELNKTPCEIVSEADVERRLLLDQKARLEGKCSTAEENEEFKACLSQLEAIDASSAAIRARKMLVNLGFSDELLGREMKALSGGWRVRVALAAALFAKPDILFLDEPTNHLSMEAVLWLAHELSTSTTYASRIIILVSHDRFFIDETCTDMLHISGVARRLTQSRGDYTSWNRSRGEQQRGFASRAKIRADQIAECVAYIASGQAAAGNTAASGRRTKIEKLEREGQEEAEELRALQEDKDLPLELHSSGELDTCAVQLQNVGFAYPGSKELFRGVGVLPHEFMVDTKTRLVLVGENGNGKTTLMKILLGELEATEGTVLSNRNAKFALVNQHHADQIDLKLSPLQFIQREVPGDRSESWNRSLRSELSRSGIDTALMDVPAAALSGGQKSRLAMAAVSAARPHVLFMDEPTNNLDVSAVEALVEAVKNFEGGVVLVSHDKYFVSHIAKEVWVVGDGKVVPCLCGFEEYWAQMLCKVDPTKGIAVDALEAYRRKKQMSQAFLSGGQASRQALAKELAEMKAVKA